MKIKLMAGESIVVELEGEGIDFDIKLCHYMSMKGRGFYIMTSEGFHWEKKWSEDND